MRYWLFKSEPEVFGIADLKAHPRRTETWDGVRNYQVRNMMRDEMSPGDLVLFYHSNADPPAVVGLAEITKGAFPDPAASDPSSRYYDPKCDPAKTRWLAVGIRFASEFPKPVPLETLRDDPGLAGLAVARRGNRLSITPVDERHFHRICQLGGSPRPGRL
jgi:predicted RNA-binding protein with PUA-like domain